MCLCFLFIFYSYQPAAEQMFIFSLFYPDMSTLLLACSDSSGGSPTAGSGWVAFTLPFVLTKGVQNTFKGDLRKFSVLTEFRPVFKDNEMQSVG